MKISNKQKKENRKKIIRVAVDIMIEKGFKTATMRAIAQKAGIGDATIYNYFPTKESIIFAYYEEHLEECIHRLKKVDGFNEFTLHEQLQTFIDIQLDLFLRDREFIDLSFNRIFFTFNQNFRQLYPIRNLFIDIVDDIFKSSIEVKEIPEQVFQETIYLLFWDYYIGIITYWLNDKSENFSDTTFIVDKSLDLFCAVLKAGLVNKVFDIASYLFKNHVINKFDGLKSHIDTFNLLKREFMGEKNGK